MTLLPPDTSSPHSSTISEHSHRLEIRSHSFGGAYIRIALSICFSPTSRCIFPVEDDSILTLKNEENQVIEPEW